MYSEEYDDEEQEEQTSENFFVNFYNNNKVLVWIFVGIIVFILIMSLLTRGGKSSKSKIEIQIVPPEDALVGKGKSTRLAAKIENKPNATFAWTVEDETIAKVDNSGTVTGLSYGKTNIIVTYIDPTTNEKYSASKALTVKEGDPSVTLTDVSFREGDLFMPLNDTYTISLILTPSNGYIEGEKYTSSDQSVVTVDNAGVVKSVGEGSAVISLDVNDGQFRKELNVYVDKECTATEIVVTPEKISFDGELRKLKVGSVENLSFTVEPKNTDIDKLIWKSSDESVLTVSNGQVKGISEGNATVTVSSLNGREAKIDIEVESDIIEVTDINLPITNIYLTVGQSQTITPIISPDNASNKALSYTPMNSSIVYVSPNAAGTQATITAISPGTTSISIKSVSMSNPVERIVNVTVTGSSGGSGGSGSGSGSSSGGDTTIVVRVDGDSESPAKSCDGQTLKYYSNGNVKIELHSGVSKVEYCYSTSGKCTPNTTITSTSTFTISGKGIYSLRIKKYDLSGKEISSSNGGNYRDGALEYFINTLGEGKTCTISGGNSGASSMLYTITPSTYDNKTEAAGNAYYVSSKFTIKLKDSNAGYIYYCIRVAGTNSCLKENTLKSGSNDFKFTSAGMYEILIRSYKTGSTSYTENHKYISISSGDVAEFNCNGLDITSCNSGQAATYCSWCGACKKKTECSTTNPTVAPSFTPKPSSNPTPAATPLKDVGNCKTGMILGHNQTCKVPSGYICHYVGSNTWSDDIVTCSSPSGCKKLECESNSSTPPAATPRPTATPPSGWDSKKTLSLNSARVDTAYDGIKVTLDVSGGNYNRVYLCLSSNSGCPKITENIQFNSSHIDDYLNVPGGDWYYDIKNRGTNQWFYADKNANNIYKFNLNSGESIDMFAAEARGITIYSYSNSKRVGLS